jgi:hypothetical protein
MFNDYEDYHPEILTVAKRLDFLEAKKNKVAFDFQAVGPKFALAIRTKFPNGFWKVRFKGYHMDNKFATLRDAIDSEIGKI